MPRLHAVVGDIHGCLDALKRLEDRIARHAAREGLEPHIVSVGDLVDRGPASAAVVRHFREGVAAGTHTALMGNHEQIMLASVLSYRPDLLEAAGATAPPMVRAFDAEHAEQRSRSSQWFPLEVYRWWSALLWLGQGGVPTLWSYGVSDPTDVATWEIDPDDLRFLCGLPLVWRADGVIVTHALVSAEALAVLDDEAADPDDWRAAADLALWGRGRPGAPPDPERTHVSGHSILPRVRRDRPRQLVQIDTGAFLGARLSAWCAETDRVITVRNDAADDQA